MAEHQDVNQSGFTVVELVVSIVVIGLLITPIFYVSFSTYLDAGRQKLTADAQSSLRIAMRNMSEDVKLAASVIASSTLADSNAPAGGWKTSQSPYRIVLQLPALNSSGGIIYQSSGQPYYNEAVYYIEGDVLYRRDIMNSSAVGNAMVTSCPTASATTGCPADSALIKNISSSSFTMRDNTNVLTTDSTQAASIDQLFTTSRMYGQTTITVTEKLTTTFRNRI